MYSKINDAWISDREENVINYVCYDIIVFLLNILTFRRKFGIYFSLFHHYIFYNKFVSKIESKIKAFF